MPPVVGDAPTTAQEETEACNRALRAVGVDNARGDEPPRQASPPPPDADIKPVEGEESEVPAPSGGDEPEVPRPRRQTRARCSMDDPKDLEALEVEADYQRRLASGDAEVQPPRLGPIGTVTVERERRIALLVTVEASRPDMAWAPNGAPIPLWPSPLSTDESSTPNPTGGGPWPAVVWSADGTPTVMYSSPPTDSESPAEERPSPEEEPEAERDPNEGRAETAAEDRPKVAVETKIPSIRVYSADGGAAEMTPDEYVLEEDPVDAEAPRRPLVEATPKAAPAAAPKATPKAPTATPKAAPAATPKAAPEPWGTLSNGITSALRALTAADEPMPVAPKASASAAAEVLLDRPILFSSVFRRRRRKLQGDPPWRGRRTTSLWSLPSRRAQPRQNRLQQQLAQQGQRSRAMGARAVHPTHRRRVAVPGQMEVRDHPLKGAESLSIRALPMEGVHSPMTVCRWSSHKQRVNRFVDQRPFDAENARNCWSDLETRPYRRSACAMANAAGVAGGDRRIEADISLASSRASVPQLCGAKRLIGGHYNTKRQLCRLPHVYHSSGGIVCHSTAQWIRGVCHGRRADITIPF